MQSKRENNIKRAVISICTIIMLIVTVLPVNAADVSVGQKRPFRVGRY